MMKIAIFCRSFQMGVEPFTSDYYWQAYQDLLFALKERGVTAYFVTDNNSYKDYGLFETAYTTSEKTTPDKLQPVKNVQADLVFDRGGFIGRNILTINSPFLLKIGLDKAAMYRHFAEYQPFSVVCYGRDDIAAAFEQMPGDKVVVKDPTSFGGGKDVFIGEKHAVLRQLPVKYPLLVQEFLDTSDGVPGFMTGVHDVRLSICGGEIVGHYIRKAKDGSLHSNISKGGKMIFFSIDKTPSELVDMVRDIDIFFARQPRYYAIDFMYTPKGWKMVEINPYLALLPRTDGAEAARTIERLADYLVGVAGSAAKRRAGQPSDLIAESVASAN